MNNLSVKNTSFAYAATGPLPYTLTNDYLFRALLQQNNHSYINLEMQVVNHSNWIERSLTYLCRAFDNLEKGEDYFHVKPVVQISWYIVTN